MGGYPSPKLAAQMQFFYLKNNVKKLGENMQEHKKLPISWKFSSISIRVKIAALKR